MSDTPQTQAYLLATSFPTNGSGLIRAQDMRDFVVSIQEGVKGAAVPLLVTPTTLLADQSNCWFYNPSTVLSFVLPAATIGLTYSFVVASANALTVTAAGSDIIRLGDYVGGAAGNVTSSNVGSVITLMCVPISGTSQWCVTQQIGTWTLS